jgi:chromosome segregation protein
MLKRLELLGFKSFASRSVFEFEAGISALVGPNGSGKSNVADAVRWVLGEQSGKALRGKKAEEVIFVGSAERHPLGMAEVALVLENGDRRLPLDFSEVRLARRLYRSGESEYLINGAQARRKDLLSLLLQVGLHAEGYTVIGQGAVDELILQKPDERRGVLEQAAEISRHQIRLSEARAKLAATAQNLTRCHDLIAELEPYARRLRVQAEKAESYTARRAQLAALAGTYYRAALAEKATDHKWAASELVRVKEECQRLEQEIASLDQQRLNARQEAAALDAQLNGLQGRLSELHQERDAQMAALASDRQQAGFLDARLEALTGQASRAAQRIAQLAEEKGAAELDASAELSVSGVERLRRLETLVDELTAELGRARSHLEAARNDQTRVAEERERMQFEDDALRERQACQREEAAQIEARRAVLKAQLDENVSLSERLERELVAGREAALAVSADLSVAQQARAAVSRELFTLRQREQKLNADVEVARAACEAIRLEAADADRGLPHSSGNGLHTNRDTLTPGPPLPPGRQEGPGERDTANGKRPNDSPGQRLGSSLTVAPEFEPAIAAALGEWARAELVADPDEAHSFVASESNGRELFIARAADGDAGPVFGTRFLRRVEQALVGIPYRLVRWLSRSSCQIWRRPIWPGSG